MKPINPEHIGTIVFSFRKLNSCVACKYLKPRSGLTSLCGNPLTCFMQIPHTEGMKVLKLLELTNEADTYR